MGWNPFGRQRSQEVDVEAEVAVLLQEALSEAGVETVPVDGALRAVDGRVFGLAGVVHRAAAAPRRTWRPLVRDHVHSLIVAQAGPDPESLEEVADLVHLRVVHRADFPTADAVARPLVGDLVVLPVLDLPESVQFLTDLDLVERLGGWDRLAATGLANLRRLRPDEVFTLQDGAVHVSGGGFLNASRVLTMETLLAQDFGLEAPTHGVLLAAPNRHLVAVHPLQGPEVVAAMGVLVDLARGESDQPGGISDQVYFWRGGTLQQVSRTGTDGGVEVTVDGALQKAMLELGLLTEG